MRIINGYKVYQREELTCRGPDEQKPLSGVKCWYSPDNELMLMGYEYHGGYRTVKEAYKDENFVKELEKINKKPFFYGDEICGWILYILTMIFGNIFVDFFPFGMISITFLFFRWRKKYRDGFEL